MNKLTVLQIRDAVALHIDLPGDNFSAEVAKEEGDNLCILVRNNDTHEQLRVVLKGWPGHQCVGLECENSDYLSVLLTSSEEYFSEVAAGKGAYLEVVDEAVLEAMDLGEKIEALNWCKGAFSNGYTPDEVFRVGAYLLGKLGLNIQVLWQYIDDYGLGGDSTIYLRRSEKGLFLFEDSIGITEWLQEGKGDPEEILKAVNEFKSGVVRRACQAYHESMPHNRYVELLP